jgi:hypothetical protein
LNKDATLREKFKNALAQFPDDLPYEVEEQKTDQGYTDHLMDEAAGWVGLGDRANYKQSQYDQDPIAVTYDRPNPLTPTRKRGSRRARRFFKDSVLWVGLANRFHRAGRYAVITGYERQSNVNHRASADHNARN